MSLVPDIPYREMEESVELSHIAHPESEELLTINFGPHHPATHGVLRLITTLEAEVVRDIRPVIGYVHTGIEKTAEDKAYWKAIPVVERMDYLAYYFNAMAFCGAVETILDLEVPARAQYLRVIHMELNRIMSHLVWLGTTALDLGAISMFWYCFRDREQILDLFEMSSGQRMHTRYFQVGGVFEDIPTGWEQKVRGTEADHRLRPHRDREDRRGQGVLEGDPRRRADGLPRLLLQRDGVLRRGRDDPRPRGAGARAVPARDPHGAQPDHVAPGLARHDRAGPRRDLDVLVLLPRPRADPRPVRDVLGPAHAHALLPGRRRLRGHPGRLGAEGPHVHRDHARAGRPVPRDPDEERDRAPAAARSRAAGRGDAARARRERAAAARRRQPVGPAQGRAVLLLRALRLQDPRRHDRATTGTA